MPAGYQGNISKSDWGGFIDSETAESNPLAMETQPNYVLAGPPSGATPDVSAFRALVAADLPSEAIQPISPLPATPVLLEDVIALLQSYGLCQ